jgi:hypothetical protein
MQTGFRSRFFWTSGLWDAGASLEIAHRNGLQPMVGRSDSWGHAFQRKTVVFLGLLFEVENYRLMSQVCANIVPTEARRKLGRSETTQQALGDSQAPKQR